MSVINGSRMGKDLAANALNARFVDGNAQSQQPIAPVATPEQSSQQGNTQSSTQSQAPPHSQTNSSSRSQSSQQASTQQQSAPQQKQSFDDFDGTLPGLDLFQLGPSVNAEEEEFARRHRRRKKRGRGL